ESDEVRIKYASKYATTSNYWKYYIGQTKGLKRLDISDKKKATEEDFQKWVNADPTRIKKYSGVISEIKDAFEIQRKYNLFRQYYRETIIRGTDIIPFAFKFLSLYDALNPAKPNPEKVTKLKESFKEQSYAYFKDFNLETDKKVLTAMLEMFYKDVPADQHPLNLTEIQKKYKGDFSKFSEAVFSKSIFSNSIKLLAFLDKPDFKTLSNDLAFKLMNQFYEKFKEVNKISNDAYEKLLQGNRLFVAGLKEMNPDKKYYPNANSTMRLSYGKILDYYPSDAVYYNYFTTLDGIIEKEDPKNEDFIVPAKLKELYKAKDYGRYAEDGTVKTCFLTNNDITGGNSGSPVINGKGQLLGLAFDANWEAMSGDIAYEPELQRTVAVDIRYVLFIVEKYAGATNLINEMTLVDSRAIDSNTNQKK
ncbi:MAG: S46 family peptidase, partial [Bacteroidetes bacterium]|nr:S46 family peptidase [Bacteroidota bacterium]